MLLNLFKVLATEGNESVLQELKYCIGNSDLHDVFQSLSEAVPVQSTQAWVTFFGPLSEAMLGRVQSSKELREESFTSVLQVVLFGIIASIHFTPLWSGMAAFIQKGTVTPPLFGR